MSARAELTDAAPRTDLVTVVIPARDEEGFIEHCLDAVLAQDHHDLQVIVVDGASRDRTPEIVRGYAERDPRVELITNPQGIIPRSLNLALEAARGRWFVRVDAHATVPPDYVTKAVARLRTGLGAVGGRKDGIGRTPAGRAVAAAMGSRFGVGDSTYHFGTTAGEVEHVPFGAYPVDLARALGGWDEELVVNQDFEFDHRVRMSGHRILFDPELRIDWHCRQTVGDLYRQYRRYGWGKARVLMKHPASMRPRHAAAPALVASWAAAAALSAKRPRLAALAVLPYPMAVAVASVLVARRLDDGAASRRVPGAFAAMHVGWGVGFWQGLASNLLRASRRRRR